jgi:hypothetical protein
MNPQCDRCTQLLLDYIAAGNHLVVIDRRTSGSEPVALAKAAATAARRRLVGHQRRLRCPKEIRCRCPNELRTRHGRGHPITTPEADLVTIPELTAAS